MLCERGGLLVACAAAWVGRLAGACRVIALVPWPGYQGARNEGGFLKDSPLEGKVFRKRLHGRMVVREAGMQQGVGVGPEQQSHRCLSSGSCESCLSCGGSGAFD